MAQPRLRQLSLPGVLALTGTVHIDKRGVFSKLYSASAFPDIGSPWSECFISTSVPGTLRGMHLQIPPHDHEKLVVCIDGRVLDVVLDLRTGSPMFARHEQLLLDGNSREGVLIPKGCAHGFCVLGNAPATLLYLTTSEHSPQADTGVRWNSFGMHWPIATPLISDRDSALSELCDFESPF